MNEALKHCNRCNRDLPRSAFIPKGKGPDGTVYRTTYCRECHNAERRSDPRERQRYMQWRDANRMWWANYMREWRAKNPGYDKRSTYCHGRLRIKPEIWDTLVEFFGGCAYCGGEATEMDHFIPKALGGSDDWDNLVPACRTCNASKNDTHPKDWEPSKSLWRILSEQRENPGEGNPREGESHPQRLSERTPVTG